MLADLHMIPGHNHRKGFFPETTFKELVHEQAVSEELRHCSMGMGSNAVNAIANTVCGTKAFKRLFVLLVIMEKVSEIQRFIDSGVSDCVLPLKKLSKSHLFHLGLDVDSGKTVQRLSCFDGWKTSEIRMFEEWQWTTIAPILEQGERGIDRHLVLQDEIPLPFEADSRSGSSPEVYLGGFSTVFKVAIHPAHHRFNVPQVGLL